MRWPPRLPALELVLMGLALPSALCWQGKRSWGCSRSAPATLPP
jgi:hypothetical protein